MHVSVYMPLVMSIALAIAGPLLARSLAPRTAARVLVIAAAITSASALWALGLLALSGLLDAAQPLADPAPWWGTLFALLAGVCALARMVAVAREHRRTVRFARSFSQDQQAGEGGLVVIADQRPIAAALPGRRGRIVVSSAMLARLGTRERRVLLSHERCHVTNRHDLYRLTGDMARAVNPLLGALRDTIDQALERWADEDAAAVVGSRSLVARTLLQAALAPPKTWRGALAFSSRGIAARVHALHCQPIDSRRSAAVVVLLAAVLAALTSADATLAIERLMHLVTIGHM